MGFTYPGCFFKDFNWLCSGLLSWAVFFRVLLGFTGFLMGFTLLNRVLLGFHGVYRVFSGLTVLYCAGWNGHGLCGQMQIRSILDLSANSRIHLQMGTQIWFCLFHKGNPFKSGNLIRWSTSFFSYVDLIECQWNPLNGQKNSDETLLFLRVLSGRWNVCWFFFLNPRYQVGISILDFVIHQRPYRRNRIGSSQRETKDGQRERTTALISMVCAGFESRQVQTVDRRRRIGRPSRRPSGRRGLVRLQEAQRFHRRRSVPGPVPVLPRLSGLPKGTWDSFSIDDVSVFFYCLVLRWMVLHRFRWRSIRSFICRCRCRRRKRVTPSPSSSATRTDIPSRSFFWGFFFLLFPFFVSSRISFCSQVDGGGATVSIGGWLATNGVRVRPVKLDKTR